MDLKTRGGMITSKLVYSVLYFLNERRKISLINMKFENQCIRISTPCTVVSGPENFDMTDAITPKLHFQLFLQCAECKLCT
jgi:hypothetical protein